MSARSLISSWIPDRFHRSDYELPLWQLDPQRALFPPPPVSGASMYSSTIHPKKPVDDLASDELLVLQRREKYLHQSLQELLDVQADCLSAGLGARPSDDRSSTGSLTPTTYSTRSNGASPQTSTRRRRPDLGSTRRGIWKTILECATVKAEEHAVLKEELRDNHSVLDQLTTWGDKRAGLLKEISSIEGQDTAAQTQSLKQEANNLQDEIKDMELRLSQMKTRQRQLLNEIADMENSVESKLSSYKSSLSLLEKDVQSFLDHPPAGDKQRATETSTFLALPPKRRTLEMAKEYWENDYTKLRQRLRFVRKDHTALEEGAIVWKDVITEITSFERFLRGEMKNIGNVSQVGKGKERAESDPETILSRMDTTIQFVEEKLNLAESKKWSLLMICIGAELEAFKEGRRIFEDIFSSARDSQHHGPSRNQKDTFETDEESNDGMLNALNASLHQNMYDTDDDDGPGPDLMMTHQEDDTE